MKYLQSHLLTQEYYRYVAEREAAVLPGLEFDEQVKMGAYEEWFNDSRNISFIFKNEQGTPLAFVAAIACSRKGWEYIHDKEKEFDEYELTGDMLFSDNDSELAIHIYMIEKIHYSINSFTQRAYTTIGKRVDELDARIIGLSGLSATKESTFISQHVLWRNEVKPVHEYTFLKGEEKMVKMIHSQKELEKLLYSGYIISHRSVLSSISRDEPSLVWEWMHKKR